MRTHECIGVGCKTNIPIINLYCDNCRNNIVCPFCGEKDFDVIGLKSHLYNSCEEFPDVISPGEDFKRMSEKK